MDLSKLPKFSETKPPEPPAGAAEPATNPQPVDYPTARYAAQTSIAAEVWIGAIIGLVLVLYTRSFGSYLGSLVLNHAYHTGVDWTDGPNAGKEVPYPQLEGGTFFSDSSIFFFGVALLVGAFAQALLASRLRSKRGIAWLSIICMLVATMYCVVVAVILLQLGITPLISILCIGVGVYIIYYEWRAVRQ